MLDKVEDKIYYVYIHRRKSDNRIFYVGKGKGCRYNSRGSRNNHWKNVVNKHGFTSKKIKTNLSEVEALELEEILIKRIGISNLTNRNYFNGGQSGYKHSEESKKMMSQSMKGRTAWNKGMKFPDISEKRKGAGNPRWGHKTVHTEEMKQKMRKLFGTIVCDLQTGIFYDSIEEACKELKTTRARIFKRVCIA